MEWLSKIFDVHKIPFKIILWICLVSGILLFAPTGFIEALKLTEFLSESGSYIGIVFIASGALVIINSIAWIGVKIRRKSNYTNWLSELKSVLLSLDRSEKAVLREFLIQGKHTIDLPVDNATVVGLTNKGIIEIVGTLGDPSLAGMLFPCSISDEVWKVLTLDMIDFPAGELSEQDINKLRDTRPDFARTIAQRKSLYDI